MTEVPPQTRIYNYDAASPAGYYVRANSTHVIYGFTSAADKSSLVSATHIFIRNKETGYQPGKEDKGTTFYFSPADYDKTDSVKFLRKDDSLLLQVDTPRNLSNNTFVLMNQFTTDNDKIPAADFIDIAYKDEKGMLQHKRVDLRAAGEGAIGQLNGYIERNPREDRRPDLSKTRISIPADAIDNVTFKISGADTQTLTISPRFIKNKNVTEEYSSVDGRKTADNFVLDLRKTDKGANIYTASYGPDAYGSYSEMLRLVVESPRENSRYIMEVPRQFGKEPHIGKLTLLTLDASGNNVSTEIDAASLRDKGAFPKALGETIGNLGYGGNRPETQQQRPLAKIESAIR